MPKESILTEVVAASIAGAFSASTLYPLEVLKTKMQAKSKDDDDYDSDNDNDNAGDNPNEGEEEECNKSSSKQNDDSDDLEAIQNPNLVTKQTRSTISSISSNSSTSSITTENKTTKKKKKKATSAIQYAKELYTQQGIAPFYAGIETSAFQSATEKALYFFAYTTLKNVYTFFAGNQKMGATINLLLGCVAEWAHLPITLPLDCWTTQIQTGENGKNGPIAILMTMLSQGDGIRGMYKGIQAYTVLCLKPAIQYTVFEQVKGILLIKKKLGGKVGNKKKNGNDVDTLTAMEAFLLGMIARTIATIATFPYLRAKVVLQSQKKKSDESTNSSTTTTTTTTTTTNSNNNGDTKPNIPSMISKMYMSGGLSECFQGLGPELTRGVFSAALMMMMKEKIAFAVRKALMGD